MPRCVYIYSIRFFDDSTRNNIFIGTNERIESVILKDWSEESWTMSSTELPVSNQWFRVEIQWRVDGSIQKISNLLMHFTGCITPWFLVCICVFVCLCVFVCTVLMIRLQICWCTTFTASTLYCEYWQLRRTFRCAVCTPFSDGMDLIQMQSVTTVWQEGGEGNHRRYCEPLDTTFTDDSDRRCIYLLR